MGSDCLKGVGFPFGGDENVLELNNNEGDSQHCECTITELYMLKW